MCPLCMGTGALLLSGGTSAGGLGALLLRQRVRRRVAGFVERLRKIGRTNVLPG